MARTNMRTTKRAPKDLGRRVKKKPCQLCRDRIEWVDYKNASMLKRYMSERGKIRARRVSGNCEQHQREIAEAIKTARELALLPYTQRTVTERRGGRGRDRDGGGREGRDDRGGGRGRPPAEEITMADLDPSPAEGAVAEDVVADDAPVDDAAVAEAPVAETPSVDAPASDDAAATADAGADN
jgi:small subunit ribosomal protein S18